LELLAARRRWRSKVDPGEDPQQGSQSSHDLAIRRILQQQDLQQEDLQQEDLQQDLQQDFDGIVAAGRSRGRSVQPATFAM